MKNLKMFLSILMCNLFMTSSGYEPVTKIKVPQLSEEENESMHLPESMRCDACFAVAHQFTELFEKGEKKRKGRELKESEVIELAEKLCGDGFEDYGVTVHDGMNHLTGPGLETKKDAGPAAVQMGGKWPGRIQAICNDYIGEIGEYEIYQAFTQNPSGLHFFLCYGTGIQGFCNSEATKPWQIPKHISLNEEL